MLPSQVQGLAHGFADILLAQAIGQAVQGDEALAFGPPFFRVRPIHLAAAISHSSLPKAVKVMPTRNWRFLKAG